MRYLLILKNLFIIYLRSILNKKKLSPQTGIEPISNAWLIGDIYAYIEYLCIEC